MLKLSELLEIWLQNFFFVKISKDVWNVHKLDMQIMEVTMKWNAKKGNHPACTPSCPRWKIELKILKENFEKYPSMKPGTKLKDVSHLQVKDL